MRMPSGPRTWQSRYTSLYWTTSSTSCAPCFRSRASVSRPPCSGSALVCPPGGEEDEQHGDPGEEAGFSELHRPEVALWLVDDVEDGLAHSGCPDRHVAAEEAAAAAHDLFAVDGGVDAQNVCVV